MLWAEMTKSVTCCIFDSPQLSVPGQMDQTLAGRLFTIATQSRLDPLMSHFRDSVIPC